MFEAGGTSEMFWPPAQAFTSLNGGASKGVGSLELPCLGHSRRGHSDLADCQLTDGDFPRAYRQCKQCQPSGPAASTNRLGRKDVGCTEAALRKGPGAGNETEGPERSIRVRLSSCLTRSGRGFPRARREARRCRSTKAAALSTGHARSRTWAGMPEGGREGRNDRLASLRTGRACVPVRRR